MQWPICRADASARLVSQYPSASEYTRPRSSFADFEDDCIGTDHAHEQRARCTLPCLLQPCILYSPSYCKNGGRHAPWCWPGIGDTEERKCPSLHPLASAVLPRQAESHKADHGWPRAVPRRAQLACQLPMSQYALTLRPARSLGLRLLVVGKLVRLPRTDQKRSDPPCPSSCPDSFLSLASASHSQSLCEL